MQWMARGGNGGYFEMMGGGWLIRRGSLLPDPREPSLAPNPRLFASQHVQSSKSTQPSCQPGHLQNLSPPQISPLVAVIRWPRPQCIYSLLSVYGHTPTHCVLSAWASIIYPRIYLYLPPFVPITPGSTKSNCVVDPFHSRAANFKILQKSNGK